MKKIKNISLWVLFALLVIIAIATVPRFVFVIAVVIALLILPTEKWQALISKYIKKPIKIAITVVLSALLIIVAPRGDNLQEGLTSSDLFSSFAVTDTQIDDTKPIGDSTLETNTTASDYYSTVVISTTVPDTEPDNTIAIIQTTDESAVQSNTILETESNTATTTESSPLVTETTHTHNFSAATCTAPKTCSCGATEGDVNGHKWIEANCTTPKTCSVCKVSEGTAKGHEWENATYSTPKKCTVCNITEGTSVEKPGKENYHGHVYTGGDSSKKFHYEDECAGKYSHEITWDEVVSRGLEPCGTCVLK